MKAHALKNIGIAYYKSISVKLNFNYRAVAAVMLKTFIIFQFLFYIPHI